MQFRENTRFHVLSLKLYSRWMIIAYGLETEETIETTEKVLTQSTEQGQKSINLHWTFLYPLALWALVNYHFAKGDKLMQSNIFLLTDRGKKLNLTRTMKSGQKELPG